MKKNILWITFTVLTASLLLWFVGKTGYALFRYAQLSQKVPIILEKWEIKERGSNRFALVALYSYNYKEKIYKQEGVIGKEFPNPWAVEKIVPSLLEKKWSAWVNPKHPEEVSLEKAFPTKHAITSLVLLGLGAYFVGLGFYIRKKESGNS